MLENNHEAVLVGRRLDFGEEAVRPDYSRQLGLEHLQRDAAVVLQVAGQVDGRPVTLTERMANKNTDRLLELLQRFDPVEAVVETSPAWPWLYDCSPRTDTASCLRTPRS